MRKRFFSVTRNSLVPGINLVLGKTCLKLQNGRITRLPSRSEPVRIAIRKRKRREKQKERAIIEAARTALGIPKGAVTSVGPSAGESYICRRNFAGKKTSPGINSRKSRTREILVESSFEIPTTREDLLRRRSRVDFSNNAGHLINLNER